MLTLFNTQFLNQSVYFASNHRMKYGKETMRKIFFALIASLFTSSAALAQDGKAAAGEARMNLTPEQRTERQVSRMNDELSLTSAQREQVVVLFNKQNAQLDEIRKAEGDNKDAMRSKMKGVKTETETALKGILDAEQFQRYQAMQQERRDKRMHHGKAAGK